MMRFLSSLIVGSGLVLQVLLLAPVFQELKLWGSDLTIAGVSVNLLVGIASATAVTLAIAFAAKTASLSGHWRGTLTTGVALLILGNGILISSYIVSFYGGPLSKTLGSWFPYLALLVGMLAESAIALAMIASSSWDRVDKDEADSASELDETLGELVQVRHETNLYRTKAEKELTDLRQQVHDLQDRLVNQRPRGGRSTIAARVKDYLEESGRYHTRADLAEDLGIAPQSLYQPIRKLLSEGMIFEDASTGVNKYGVVNTVVDMNLDMDIDEKVDNPFPDGPPAVVAEALTAMPLAEETTTGTPTDDFDAVTPQQYIVGTAGK